jgi:hypothetical protein
MAQRGFPSKSPNYMDDTGAPITLTLQEMMDVNPISNIRRSPGFATELAAYRRRPDRRCSAATPVSGASNPAMIHRAIPLMQYIARFPLPDASDLERLWRGMFPPQTPLAADIDFEYISTQFLFTGGQIQNVALDAAFSAAGDGGVMTKSHITRTIAQQLTKEGRNLSVADFQHRYSLLSSSSLAGAGQ